MLIEALFRSMTGFDISLDAPPVDARQLAGALARRNEAFRVRILQIAIVCALVVRPLPQDTVERLDAMASALSVDDGMLIVARDFAAGSLGLASLDFERNGYTSDWGDMQRTALLTTESLTEAW